jgi:hypothetical protein
MYFVSNLYSEFLEVGDKSVKKKNYLLEEEFLLIIFFTLVHG